MSYLSSRILRRRVQYPVMLLCLGAILGTAPGVYAQGEPDGGRIKLGETDLYPSIRLEYGLNDNAFLENDNVEDTTRISLQPSLIWFASQKSTSLRAEYRGDYASHSVSELDYQDHTLNFLGRSVLGRQWRVATSLDVSRRSFELGAERTFGNARQIGEPFTFNDLNFAAVGTFGADRARGNLDFGVRMRQLDPVSQVDSADDFAYNRIAPFALFSLRLSRDTRLTFEARFSDYDYDLDTRDRSEAAFLVGARFAATGRLTGSFEIGSSAISSDNVLIDGTSDLIAEAEIAYSLTEAALFTLNGSRRIDNATTFNAAEGDGRIRNTVTLQWDQEYSARVAHKAYVLSELVDRSCPFRGSSEAEFGYELGVSVRRWMDIGGFYRNQSRSFDMCPGQFDTEIDYDNQRIGVFINVTL
ncbi:MAG: outer membrane beta-barrel protein [Granulosicoccus sp.]